MRAFALPDARPPEARPGRMRGCAWRGRKACQHRSLRRQKCGMMRRQPARDIRTRDLDRDRSFRPRRRRSFDEPDFEPPPSRDYGAPSRPRAPSRFDEQPSGPPVRAVVKWFKSDKGFGFVELSDGSGDAFLHATVLGRIGVTAANPGEALEARGAPA